MTGGAVPRIVLDRGMTLSARPPDAEAGVKLKRFAVRKGLLGERQLQARGGPRQVNGHGADALGLDDRAEVGFGEASSRGRSSVVAEGGLVARRRSSVVLGEAPPGKPSERESARELDRSQQFVANLGHHLTSEMPASVGGTDDIQKLVPKKKKIPIPSYSDEPARASGALTDRPSGGTRLAGAFDGRSIFPDLSHILSPGAQTSRRTCGPTGAHARVLFSLGPLNESGRILESDAARFGDSLRKPPLYVAGLNAPSSLTFTSSLTLNSPSLNTARSFKGKIPIIISKQESKGEIGFGNLSPWEGGQGVW